jgi:hypothetical protein
MMSHAAASMVANYQPGAREGQFNVARYFTRPEGAGTKQPRATPGLAVAKPSTEPCKGDTSPVGRRALSGIFPSFFAVFCVIRALPWAVLSGPLRGQNHRPRNSKTCASGLCTAGVTRHWTMPALSCAGSQIRSNSYRLFQRVFFNGRPFFQRSSLFSAAVAS